MTLAALQPDSAWAEDRATLRSDPSAVPGAKTDGAARGRPVLHSPHRDWQQSDKPSQQDAVTALARCLSPLANSNRPTFHFPLNQDKEALTRPRLNEVEQIARTAIAEAEANLRTAKAAVSNKEAELQSALGLTPANPIELSQKNRLIAGLRSQIVRLNNTMGDSQRYISKQQSRLGAVPQIRSLIESLHKKATIGFVIGADCGDKELILVDGKGVVE
jgi:hypothetical protein